jgi:hypothetical protein
MTLGDYRNTAQCPAYLYYNRRLGIVQVDLALWVHFRDNISHNVYDFLSGNITTNSSLYRNGKGFVVIGSKELGQQFLTEEKHVACMGTMRVTNLRKV